MDESDSDGPSHDPRTWITRKPAQATTNGAPATETAAADQPAVNAASFNPKTWRTTTPLPPPPAAPRPRPRRTGAVALMAFAAVLLIGGGLAFVLHGHLGPGAAARPPPAAPPPTDIERQSLVVSSPDDIPAALTGHGVVPAEAASAASAAKAKLVPGPGDLTLIMMLEPVAGGSHVVSLDARHDNGAGVIVSAARDGGFISQATSANLKTAVKVVRGEMDAYSFYSSAVAQHLNSSLISPFAQALTFDFDFQREIPAGAVFEAAFEDRENAQGESVGVGRLLYVSLETPAKSRGLYWFQPAGAADGGWFDGNGRSTVRSLMRTPVEGARVSSTFGMREHPVLGFMKMHKGVDFAAPIGTPIYAAGDGTILHAEMKGPNGNYVEIQHDNGWQTFYLHMNAFAPGIAPGVRVRQGQQIGAIGTTGRSTGPHVHYELHVDNQPVDPMSIKMDSGRVLDGPSLKAFFKERDRIDALRAAQTG